MRKAALPLLMLLACLAAGPVHATCSNPRGNEADQIYNYCYHTYQFCNGTSWIPMMTVLNGGLSGSGGGCGGGASGSTWNPSDKGTGITLSGGNLLATQNSVSTTSRMVRSTSSYTVGTNHKVVFGITVSAYDNNNGWYGGLADSTASLSNYVGSSGKALGIEIGGADYYVSGGATFGINCNSGLNVGSTLYFAVDFNTGNVWCSSGCTGWGSAPDSGSANNGTLPSGTTFFIAWSGSDYLGVSDAATLNTSPSLAACSGVSTFGDWN